MSELSFSIVAQQINSDDLKKAAYLQPPWTEILYKFQFGIYLLVSIVVLKTLLIAMMSNTYQRIQNQSDIEWKFGLSKIMREVHQTTSTPSPTNLITVWLFYFISLCQNSVRYQKFKMRMRSLSNKSSKSKSLSISRNSMRLLRRLSTRPSNHSIINHRIENATDWIIIAQKYRAINGSYFENQGEPTEEVSGNSDSPLMMLKNQTLAILPPDQLKALKTSPSIADFHKSPKKLLAGKKPKFLIFENRQH